MSTVKGSWSRVRDARKFGREMERIFGRKKLKPRTTQNTRTLKGTK